MLTPIEAGFAPAHSERASKDGIESGMAAQFRKLMNRVIQYTTDFGSEQVEGLLTGIDVGPLPIPKQQTSARGEEKSTERNPDILVDRRDVDRSRQSDDMAGIHSQSAEADEPERPTEEDRMEDAEGSGRVVPESVVEHLVKQAQSDPDQVSAAVVLEGDELVEEESLADTEIGTQYDAFSASAEPEAVVLEDDELVEEESLADTEIGTQYDAFSASAEPEAHLMGDLEYASQETEATAQRQFGEIEERSNWSDESLEPLDRGQEQLEAGQAEPGAHRRNDEGANSLEMFENNDFGEVLYPGQSSVSEKSRTTSSQLSDLIKLSSNGKEASKGGDGGSNLLKLAAGLQEVLAGPSAKTVDSNAVAGKSQVQGLSWKQDSLREPLTESSKRGTQSRAVLSKLFEKVEEIVKDVEKSKDGRSISIRLDPPKLGTVRVQMNVVDGSIHARFSAENPAITQLLRERADELQALLRKIGQNLDQATISFGGENFSQTHGESRFSFAKSHEEASASGMASAGFEVNGEQGVISRLKINSEHSHWVA
jgi:flagellar hook-length control protein FliK